LRLLVDEHYTIAIAVQLRALGHDVIHVVEVADLRGASDPLVLEWAALNGRALVTENVRDFLPLHSERLAAGEHHAGILLTNPRQFPRSTDSIGLFVRSIDAYLKDRPAGSSLADAIEWLKPAPEGA